MPLKSSINRRRSKHVRVRLNSRKFYVHRLVLYAFCGPAPEGMECCHDDGNPLNNAIANLRWDSGKINQQDRIKHGTHAYGERHQCAKLNSNEVICILELTKTGIPSKEIAARAGISKATVSRIKNGQTWKQFFSEREQR